MAVSVVGTFLDGLDHIVLAVRDLEAAASRWRSVGFAVSPPGLHSPHLGTANHTIMLEDDYVELLGVLQPTEFNTPTRSFLDREEGLERLAMRGRDARQAVETLHASGIAVAGPLEFRRPVSLPDGSEAEAAFRIFSWPDLPAPGGARVFACQHLTRDKVWIPDLLSHPNGAVALHRVDIRVEEPRAEADCLAGMLGLSVIEDRDGGWRVEMRPRGADVVFRSPSDFSRLWGMSAGKSALVMTTRDPEAAADWSGRHARSGQLGGVELGAASLAFVPCGTVPANNKKN